MPTIVVVGLQWGDEGKGKVIDILADSAAHVVRSQGGSNAGHTVRLSGREFAFHLIPSGILVEHTICYLGGGVLIQPRELLLEIQQLKDEGIEFGGRFFISPHAHLVFPFHQQLDRLYEARRGSNAIGTTGKGIGPCLQDVAHRIGIRIGDLLNPPLFKQKLAKLVQFKNEEFQKIFSSDPIDLETVAKEYLDCGELLKPYIADVEGKLARAVRRDENLLIEGAHGTLLDPIFGTVPFVTSSLCTAAGICAGAGIGPGQVDEVIGVLKAYNTRVGAGPFPTELSEEEKRDFLDVHEAREIGTTTGRKRRIGWFDGPLAKWAIQLNGINQLVVTKLDVLDGLKKIKICTGYQIEGEKIPSLYFPTEQLEKVQPIYEVLDGWEESTKAARSRTQLPFAARRYLDKIEEICELPIGVISVGPGREETIFIEEEWD